VTFSPASVRAEDVERLRSHGWSDSAIHDAIQVIAYFNYINRVADAVGIEDEPEWLEAGEARVQSEPSNRGA
jgi:alkylhydroperoxidase family enzyme